jgi:hypothetical protein
LVLCDIYNKRNIMKENERKCPLCDEIIIYGSKYNRNSAEKKQRPCRSCSGKETFKKYGSNIITINEEVKSGKRKNGFQDKHHTPETKKTISLAHLKNSESYKTTEFRKKMSSVTSGEKNPMFGKTVYDVWLEKYGIEEADKRDIERKKKWSLKSKGENNPMYGKEAPSKSGKGIGGWYKGFHFRSLHELKFLLISERFKLKIRTAENIRIEYISYNGNRRTYSPDYIVNDRFLTEIKPKRLQTTPLNELKFESARKYCDENGLKFKVKDFGVVYQNQLDELISDNLVKLH